MNTGGDGGAAPGRSVSHASTFAQALRISSVIFGEPEMRWDADYCTELSEVPYQTTLRPLTPGRSRDAHAAMSGVMQ